MVDRVKATGGCCSRADNQTLTVQNLLSTKLTNRTDKQN